MSAIDFFTGLYPHDEPIPLLRSFIKKPHTLLDKNPEDFQIKLAKQILHTHLHNRMDEIHMDQLAAHIIRHRQSWKVETTIGDKVIFIKKDPSQGLHRSIIYDGFLDIVIVLLNRKKEKDPLLGRGTYKNVTLAVNMNSGELYASGSLKMATKANGEFSAILQRKIESEELRGFEITNGLKGFTQLITGVRYSTSVQPSKLRLIMQLADKGTLSKAFIENTSLDKWAITEDLLEALSVLHRKGFVFRDLKPQNILLYSDGDKVKPLICDFGSICSVDNSRDKEISLTTYYWASPEHAYAQISSPYKDIREWAISISTTQRLDSWSLGVILWELWQRPPPPWVFVGGHRILQSICENAIFFENHRATAPKTVLDPLLFGLLKSHPLERLSIQNALDIFRKLKPKE